VLKTQICVTRPQCVNIILLSTSGSSKRSLSLRFPNQIPVKTSPVPHTYCMLRPSYVSWFGHPINSLWGLQIINRGYEADVFNFTKKKPLSVECFSTIYYCRSYQADFHLVSSRVCRLVNLDCRILKLWHLAGNRFFLNFVKIVCTRVKNLHIQTIEYLINKNYNLMLTDIKNCTYWCLMLDNYFRRSRVRKQSVHYRQKLPTTCKKEKSVEIDSSAPSRGHRKYVKYANFPGPPAEAALLIFIAIFFC